MGDDGRALASLQGNAKSERLAYPRPPPLPAMEGWNREGFTCEPPPGLEAFRAPPGLEGLGGLEAFASCSTGQFMANTFEDVLFGPPGLWPRNEEREERLTCAVAHASRVLRLLGEGGGVQEHPREVIEEQRGDMAEEQRGDRMEDFPCFSAGSATNPQHGDMTEEQRVDMTEEQRGDMTEKELGAGERGGELTAEDRCDLVGHSQILDYAKALDLDGFEGLATVAAVILLRLDDIAGRGGVARRAVNDAAVAVRNVLILVCTRDVMIEALNHQGIPAILRERILTAFQGCIRDHIYSDLGTAKYHLFNEGRKFSRRRARGPERRRGRMQKADAESD